MFRARPGNTASREDVEEYIDYVQGQQANLRVAYTAQSTLLDESERELEHVRERRQEESVEREELAAQLLAARHQQEISGSN